jgi:predicted  nucleic acid-binding Zn-ribbon protein
MRLPCRSLVQALSVLALSTPALWGEVSVPPATVTSKAGDEALEAGLRNLSRVSSKGTQADREKALEVVIALGESTALGPLGEELGRVAVELRLARADALQLAYEILRKEELIADLERRAERDESLDSSLERQKNRLEELQGRYASRKGRAESLDPWYAVLSVRVEEFAGTVSSGARKKVEKALWKTVGDDEADAEKQRGAAIEVLGCLGGVGTAVRLQKEVASLAKERTTLRTRLPKLMKEVIALEKRMQEEAERMDGRTSLGQQYQRAKAEAAGVQKRISLLGLLCDTAVVAGGRALAREEDAAQEKSLASLLKSQRKGKHGARRYSLQLIGASRTSAADEVLFGMLADAKEPMVRQTLIEVLTQGAIEWGSDELRTRFHDALLETLILDASWFVRSEAVGALSQIRSRDAIPVLIERLEEEQGRMLDDLSHALVSLTGQDFHGNVALWRRWWAENGEAFIVPPLDEIRQAQQEKEQERRGSTFFGISTESNRVLYVIDLSGSMNFSMIPRDNPDDEQGKEYDMPRKGERSRLAEAKLSLEKAIAGTARGGLFNIIFYASDVWPWSDSLEEFTDESASEAMEMVSRLEAIGATNIYGALKAALEMAGADPGDRWAEPDIDTIYFLSDGRASVGLATEPDEILRFVRELNASAGIVIHTIGLSGAQDAYLLRSLAEQNGGTYVSR